jgi:hypothetical protein
MTDAEAGWVNERGYYQLEGFEFEFKSDCGSYSIMPTLIAAARDLDSPGNIIYVTCQMSAEIAQGSEAGKFCADEKLSIPMSALQQLYKDVVCFLDGTISSIEFPSPEIVLGVEDKTRFQLTACAERRTPYVIECYCGKVSAFKDRNGAPENLKEEVRGSAVMAAILPCEYETLMATKNSIGAFFRWISGN